MRINKYLADCGVASRRSCDKLIADGEVTVNGKICTVGQDIKDGDVVEVSGKRVSKTKKYEYKANKGSKWIFNKKKFF